MDPVASQGGPGVSLGKFDPDYAAPMLDPCTVWTVLVQKGL